MAGLPRECYRQGMRSRPRLLLVASVVLIIVAATGALGRTDGADAPAFLADPASLDRALAGADRASAQQLARDVLPAWIERGVDDPSFRTERNFQRLARLAEALDPDASPADVTRALRRRFYDDSLFEFAGFDIGDRDVSISPELLRELGRVYRRGDAYRTIKHGWQEVVDEDGEPVDVAHALVALDAAQTTPGMGGTFRAWLFTDFGDFATGVASTFGAKAAGNANDPDLRGNALGDELVDAYRDELEATGRSRPLSSILGDAFGVPRDDASSVAGDRGASRGVADLLDELSSDR